MMSFCRLIASRRNDISILIIVTEEWLGHLIVEENPDSISFMTIPNFLPSEQARVLDHASFMEAVLRDMKDPVEQVFDSLDRRPDLIVADAFLPWAMQIGSPNNIPVASFWPASASLLSIFCNLDLVVSSKFYPIDPSVRGDEERIHFIPGIPPILLADLPDLFQLHRIRILNVIKEAMSFVSQAQLILINSVNILEEGAIEAIQTKLCLPIYPIGPAIPYFNPKPATTTNEPNYIKWLDSQEERSVLYISLGSFLATENAQLDELATGLKESGVRFLWVARDQASLLSDIVGDKGMVISWCDQMRVLQHNSIGGFITNCGWNTALETVFVGVPPLTFPLIADQPLSSKIVVEDWKIGWRLRKNCHELVPRDEIMRILKRFMDLESYERKELDENCKFLRESLRKSVEEDGSSSSVDLFLSNVLKH